MKGSAVVTEILTRRGRGVRRRPAPAVRAPPRRAAGPPGRAPRRDRPHRPAGLPAGDRAGPRVRVDGAARPGRPGRPAGRDHRADRTQDDHQRAELRGQGVAGRPGGRQHPALGQRGGRPAQPRTTRSAGPSRWRPAAKSYALGHGARSRRSWCARAAGTSTSGTCRSTARPAVGALVDFGLYFFHNAAELLAPRQRPVLLPAEAGVAPARRRSGTTSSTHAQEALGIARGTIRATVLIETIPAAFEMDEILWALRPHVCGLNAGRWDYLFSIIKNFRDAGPSFVLPDRVAVTMTAPMMRAYSELLVADLPPARGVRDGRHGGVHPEPARRRRQRGRVREGPRGQGTRGRRRLRRFLGGPPRPGAGLCARSSTGCSATGPTSSTGSAPT